MQRTIAAEGKAAAWWTARGLRRALALVLALVLILSTVLHAAAEAKEVSASLALDCGVVLEAQPNDAPCSPDQGGVIHGRHCLSAGSCSVYVPATSDVAAVPAPGGLVALRPVLGLTGISLSPPLRPPQAAALI